MGRWSLWILVFTVIGLIGLVGATALAATSPVISTDPAFDTPERTYGISGTEYTVASLGYTDVGDPLSYTVKTGNSSVYNVHLYNSEKRIETSRVHTEDGTHTFDTTGITPGTYVLVLEIDGSYEAIHPVVISGYEFAVEAPPEKSEDEAISITVELTSTSGTPNRVDIAVMNETVQRNYITTKVGDRTYNVIITDLEPGEYRIYAGTRGADEVDGRDELTGISAVQPLSITAAEPATTTTTTTTTTESGGSTTQQTTTTPTATTTTTVTTSANSTTTNTTTTGATNATSTPTSTPTTSTEPTTTTAIQPASTTTQPTTAEAPGFTQLTIAFGILIATLLLARCD